MQLSKTLLEARLADVNRQLSEAMRIVDQATGAKMAMEMLLREFDGPDAVKLPEDT